MSVRAAVVELERVVVEVVDEFPCVAYDGLLAMVGSPGVVALGEHGACLVLADAGVAVTVLPATDLFLTGRDYGKEDDDRP